MRYDGVGTMMRHDGVGTMGTMMLQGGGGDNDGGRMTVGR